MFLYLLSRVVFLSPRDATWPHTIMTHTTPIATSIVTRVLLPTAAAVVRVAGVEELAAIFGLARQVGLCVVVVGVSGFVLNVRVSGISVSYGWFK